MIQKISLRICVCCCTALVFWTVTPALAQCSNTSLGGYTHYASITTANQALVAGATASNYLTLQYNTHGGTCSDWKLTVKATSVNFSDGGGHNVPVQYVSLRYNGMGGNTVPLSAAENVLIQNGNPLSGYNVEQTVDMIMQGGSPFNLPNGTYSANVVFYLRNNNNALVASWGATFSFAMNVQPPVYMPDNCTGITLSGNGGSGYTFTTYAALMAGATVPDAVTLAYNLQSGTSNCPNWKLTVKAASPYFSNGTDNVSIANSSLQFSSTTGPMASEIGLVSGLIPLSTSEQVIINQSGARLKSPPYNYFNQIFDLVIQGGTYLIQPTTGTYTVNLVFTLYDGNGQFISSFTIPSVGFQNQFSGTNSGMSLSLQNGGNAADFDFSTIANRANGITLVKNNALKITAYQDYKVYAQTISDDLVATTTSHTIPVSVIHLAAGLSSPISGVFCNTIQLSSANVQPLINNTNHGASNTVEYNLTYFINGSAPDLLNVPAATYSGTLVFVAQPD